MTDPVSNLPGPLDPTSCHGQPRSEIPAVMNVDDPVEVMNKNYPEGPEAPGLSSRPSSVSGKGTTKKGVVDLSDSVEVEVKWGRYVRGPDGAFWSGPLPVDRFHPDLEPIEGRDVVRHLVSDPLGRAVYVTHEQASLIKSEGLPSVSQSEFTRVEAALKSWSRSSGHLRYADGILAPMYWRANSNGYLCGVQIVKVFEGATRLVPRADPVSDPPYLGMMAGCVRAWIRALTHTGLLAKRVTQGSKVRAGHGGAQKSHKVMHQSARLAKKQATRVVYPEGLLQTYKHVRTSEGVRFEEPLTAHDHGLLRQLTGHVTSGTITLGAIASATSLTDLYSLLDGAIRGGKGLTTVHKMADHLPTPHPASRPPSVASLSSHTPPSPGGYAAAARSCMERRSDVVGEALVKMVREGASSLSPPLSMLAPSRSGSAGQMHTAWLECALDGLRAFAYVKDSELGDTMVDNLVTKLVSSIPRSAARDVAAVCSRVGSAVADAVKADEALQAKRVAPQPPLVADVPLSRSMWLESLTAHLAFDSSTITVWQELKGGEHEVSLRVLPSISVRGTTSEGCFLKLADRLTSMFGEPSTLDEAGAKRSQIMAFLRPSY
nr:hypothetical protein 3 [signal crayfish associated toti-like virus 1]